MSKEEWNQAAANYSSSFAPLFQKELYPQFVPLIPSKAKRIFSFGDGPGEPSLTLSKNLKDINITVTDPSLNMIEIAKQRFENAKEHLLSADYEFIVDPRLDSVEFVDKFDAVVACLSLMFVEMDNRDETFKQLRGMLKQGI